MKLKTDRWYEFRVFHYLLKIKIGYRLLVLILLPAIPIFLSTAVAIQQNVEIYINNQRKLEGINFLLHLDQLMRYTQIHRDTGTGNLQIHSPGREKLVQSSRESILAIIAAIDKLPIESIDTAAVEEWKTLKAGILITLNQPAGSAGAYYRKHSGSIKITRLLMKRVAVRTGIFLDPSGTTYYLLIAGLEDLPDIADCYGQIGYLVWSKANHQNVDDMDSLDSEETRLSLSLNALNQTVASLASVDSDKAEMIRKELDQMYVAHGYYDDAIQKVLSQQTERLSPEMDTLLFQKYSETMESIYRLQSMTTDLSRFLLQQEQQRAMSTMLFLFALSGIIGMIALLLAILIAWSINKPIRAAIQLTEAMSLGDFTHKIKVQGEDEMAHFLSTVNALSSNLAQMVVGIHDTAKQTAESALELSTASTEFSRTAHTQAEAVHEASSAIEEITASTEEIAGSMQNSASSIQEIHGNLKHLSNISEQVKTTMDQLNSLAMTTSDSAAGSGVQIGLATEAMKRIEETTNRITEFTSIITGISDKTNLLSLNASIEAARAGDAGRGFAVVAEEISRLAEQTINSVKEVKSLIDETMDAVQNGGEQVRSVAQNLSRMFTDIQEIGTHTSRIMEMFHSQATNTHSIAESSDSVNRVFGQILSSVSEQKRAAGDIERTMSHLAGDAQVVSDNAKHLSDLATSFKIWSEYMLKTVDVFKV